MTLKFGAPSPGASVRRAGGTSAASAPLPFLNAKDFGAKGDNSTDDTAAIQAAIDAAGSFNSNTGVGVQLGSGNFKHTGLQLRSKVPLAGAGKSATTLKLMDGANQHSLRLADGRQEQVSVTNMRIFGNKSTQSGLWHGIYLHNDSETAGVFGSGFNNPHHYFANLIIDKCSGDGIFTDGDNYGGAIHAHDIFSYSHGRYGYNLVSPDSFYSGLDAGGNGDHGFYLKCANTRIVNCKSWYSGATSATADGFYIPSTAKRIELSNCEAQDNARNGITFDGCSENYAVGFLADSNGTQTPGSGYGIAFINAANLNHVIGHASNRTGSPTQSFGVRFDSNTHSNAGVIVLGSNAVTGVSGSPGNNPVTIVRGIGANRHNFVGNLEFGADNAYDLGVASNRPRNLLLGGGISTGLKYVNSGVYSVTANDSVLMAATGATGVQLPTAVGASGRQYKVKNLTGSALPVSSAGGNVEGGASTSLANGAGATFVSDGTNWWIV